MNAENIRSRKHKRHDEMPCVRTIEFENNLTPIIDFIDGLVFCAVQHKSIFFFSNQNDYHKVV